ncbi:primosomal protein N' family DNA-binding protein [Micrococcoides hystricis]|uniref:Probable replication restart protein PriA n=1 Tax=Micrococcoides hystricis TaxID=1572761 RepID=A0ABV6P7F8_9MICC
MSDETLFAFEPDDGQDELFGPIDTERDFSGRADLADPPLARVHLETPVPHLDRTFDYLVPTELGESAQPGARIRAKFGHQFLNGFVLERMSTTRTDAKLQELDKVLSAHPVLPESTYRLCKQVAARFAGTVADVLRSAVPPRVASIDKEFAAAEQQGDENSTDESTEDSAQQIRKALNPHWESEGFPDEVSRLAAKMVAEEHIRARIVTPLRYGPQGWPQLVASMLATVYEAEQGAIVIVPDQQNLDRLEEELQGAGFTEEVYARLTAEDGPTPRYRNYLKVATGKVKIVIGTRSAVFAPVQDETLMIVVDDANHNHSEPRAPYWNTRDVALLRAQQQDTSLLFIGPSPSVHTQRLVEIGYLEDYQPLRERRGSLYPRVIVAADEYYQEREYGPGSHRIPSVAWQVITRALKRGPVLVQVARTGFIPAVRCVRCGTQARCPECTGPLGYQDKSDTESGTLVCRWCGRHEHQPQCQECSSTVFKAAHRGAERTAEELGRAFANVPVISSAGDHIRTTITQKSVLVVATPGGEPVAPEGYAAVILLDGNTMLAREGLDAPADVFHRWTDALALAQPHHQDGLCVITADPGQEVNTLARLDIPGYFSHLYHQRQQTQLPPVRRYATVDGAPVDVKSFVEHVQHQLLETSADPEHPPTVSVIGPSPLDPDGKQVRTLLFYSYRDGAAVSAALRGTKAAFSAKKRYQHDPVRVKVDPDGVL